MTLTDLKNLFATEISALYTSAERKILFEIIAEKFLSLNKIEQKSQPNFIIEPEMQNTFNDVIHSLKSGMPYQQILGETEFFGSKFLVNKHVLIPRPETEELLELAIEKMKDSAFANSEIKILDIGTGSGIIPIILKKHFPLASISAIDYSADALVVARKNAEIHGVKINFIHQNYMEEKLEEIYDIILSNPPYIGQDEVHEIEDSVKIFEPEMALFSPTNNALLFYEKIAIDCKKNLAKNGLLFLEINQKLGRETADLYKEVLSEVELLKDLSGNDRMVWGRR